MNFSQELLCIRLAQHQISAAQHAAIPDLVGWMGAMQAQELSHAIAGVGLRLPATTEAQVAQAIAQAQVVHTWAMRGTLHLVAAADVWWMQQLLGAGVMARTAGAFLKGGLDPATLEKALNVLAHNMPGAGPVLRSALVSLLADAGIDMRGPFSSRIFTAAAYAGMLCMGPLQGKQETFVWLEDVVPRPPDLPRAEAIARLAARYFQSHGPATLADFVAWSGLGIREARAGMDALGGQLALWQTHDGQAFFWIPRPEFKPPSMPRSCLLPGFDEYLIGYRDRSWVLPAAYFGQAVLSNGIFKPLILIDGVAHGTWKRKVARGQTVVELSWFEAPVAGQLEAICEALAIWERFWEMPIRLA